ncbi:hypothetical protein GKZ28_27110, partial [Clostridium chromiireducens]
EQLELQRKQEEERKHQEQIELQRKQEEDRKYKEQLELQRKQEEERKHQEQLELQRKQEEDRKYKEQLELQRKQEEERKRQEQLELKRKQEEERKHQEQLELQRKQEEDLELIKKYTGQALYHNTFGKGVFSGFDTSRKYIYVKFENEVGIKEFLYPSSIEKYLFFHKSANIEKRENFLKIPGNLEEDSIEKQHFEYICKVVDKSLKRAKFNDEIMKYGYNDFSDSFDQDIFKQRQNTISEHKLWEDIRRNPYFARIDFDKDKKLYIGKNPIENEVIDWREKICILYYQYNVYIGNKEYNLSLVRDFDIISGKYYGFFNKYSIKENYSNESMSEDLIADKFLINIISANRENKQTHDIIQTIQKNQYDMITFEKDNNVIVLGCAGSGKTMIMFHRLSYMIFNDRDIDLKNLYIISPTKFLNLESDELSSTLKINNINRLEVNTFYINIIKQYFVKNRTYNDNVFKNIQSNSLISEEFIAKIYSFDFIQNFVEKIKDIMLGNTSTYTEFVKKENNNLINQYNVFLDNYNQNADIFNAYKGNKELNECYFELDDITRNLPLENVIEKIKWLEKQIRNPNNKDKTLIGKKEVLEYLKMNADLSGVTKYTKRNGNVEYSVDDAIFKDTFSYFDVLSKENKNILKKFPALKRKFETPLKLFSAYKVIVDKIQRFEDFTNGYRKNNYFSEIIYELIYEIKEDIDISVQDTYEFELFLHLVGCYEVFGGLHTIKTYIFIDEFQDYSYSELSLYEKIFPKSIFNLFGDLNQSINVKGLSETEINRFSSILWHRFTINENYRNAHQITEHINSEFNMNIIPIGINGSVQTCIINHQSLISNLVTTDRIALIVKNVQCIDELINEDIIDINSQDINLIFDENCSIKKGCINVIPINLAKGLEFEQVYVISSRMTNNEKYVAYTRALNKLYIVN